MSDINYDVPMDWTREDMFGFTGVNLENHVGDTFNHLNGKHYTVIKVTWFGDTDQWALIYVFEDGQWFTRTAVNFFGAKDDKIRMTMLDRE